VQATYEKPEEVVEYLTAEVEKVYEPKAEIALSSDIIKGDTEAWEFELDNNSANFIPITIEFGMMFSGIVPLEDLK
jgi:hypothetical protein